MDLKRDLDYDPLLQALIDKTRAGKLEWQETADEKTFLAAVKGEQTFQISLKTVRPPFATANMPVYILTVKDRNGRIFLETPEVPSETAKELFQVARRVATRLDDRIQSSLELLNQL